MKLLLPLFVLLFGLVSCGPAETTPITQESAAEDNQAEERIISLSGSLTELLYDLGYAEQVVGVDVTSVYPPEVNNVPKLGHVSKLNVEGLLELKPTMVVVDA
ncbi:MAG: ABC transporter substrate-binding protein, partial [Bacteroidota bacterium]